MRREYCLTVDEEHVFRDEIQRLGQIVASAQRRLGKLERDV
jgi:hypothetical protein